MDKRKINVVVCFMCMLIGFGECDWCAPKLFESNRWTLQIKYTDQGPEIVDVSFDTHGL